VPDLLKFETVWVLGRQPTMDETLLTKLVQFYKAKGVDVAAFVRTDHNDCPL